MKAEMQRRHFNTIAAIIARMDNFDHFPGDVAAHFARELASTNPNFDRARFLRACGSTTQKDHK